MAGSNENSSTNSEATAIALFVVIVGGAVLLWFFWRQPIILASYFVDRIQIMIYAQIMGLGERGTEYLDYLSSFFDGRQVADRVSWEEFSRVSEVVGTVVRLPMAIGIAAMAVLVYAKMKGRGFSKQLTLLNFIDYQAEHWGTLVPSARFQPDKQEKNTMPAKTPSEWMHDLGLKVRVNHAGILPEESRQAVEKAFAKQLGAGWAPVPRLKLHVRVLLAMFTSHGNKAKGALQLREGIARLYADVHDAKKRDAALEEIIKPFLADEKGMADYVKIAERHAYVCTALIAILREVRKRQGVLASAEFVWLKKIDRDLWYGMNDTGRNAYHIESGGIFSHYFYENVSKRSHVEPKVESAVLGLEEYITHHGIDELDDSAEAA